MNVQIPVKWVQELLALCGPEDHELRERVMVSITAMNEQAAGPVVTPEPDAAIKEVMELVGAAMDSAMKAGELLLDSHEKFNAQFASAKSLKNSIESKLRALLATATGLPAQQVEMPDFDLRTSKGGRGFVAWYFANVLQRYDYENYITNKLAADFACDLAKALSSTLAAPQAQADARAAELLGFLQDQCIDLRCFTTSDGEDVGWRTVQHHMDKPHERVVSEVCSDDPRRAIREAMARIERDPYCTGPLHLEDDAAIAAAKGEA